MVLVIDNYDSFTYNIVQYIGELGYDSAVFRNDAIDIGDIIKMKPEKIVISPGPKSPVEAGITVNVIKSLYSKIPILGVCLGHQAIGYAFGADIIRAKNVMHGKVSSISHDSSIIYNDVPNPFEATRYHSLIIKKENLPSIISVTSTSLDDNEIMGIEIKGHKVYGVQFHPESVLTYCGKQIMRNFLSI